MADPTRDDWRAAMRNRANDGNGFTILGIAIGVVIALLFGFWLFTDTPNDATTRTSAPATNQTDTTKTSPGTTKPQ